MTDSGAGEAAMSEFVTPDSAGPGLLPEPEPEPGPGPEPEPEAHAQASSSGKRGLWRHRDFMSLWIGQSVSEVGSSVTMVALPLAAVVLLHASAFQVGLLSAAGTASFLLVALPAGLVVDRVAKRWLMLSCDVARMLIIGSVAVAAAFGVLTMAQLFAVALLAGLATVFFDVAYQSYVPSLIDRDQLHEGNGKLGASQAFAGVVGPSLGGALFSLLRAGAMSVDSASYAVSTISLLLIRAREPKRATTNPATNPATQPGALAEPQRGRLRQEVFAGLRFVLSHPVLRKIAACTGTANLFGAMSGALEILFLVRVVHIKPAEIGLLFGIGSLGGVLGGVLSGRLSKWIGTARIIWFSMLVFGAIPIVLPLTAAGPRLVFFPIASAGLGFTALVYNIAQLSYRQLITPPELLGRMNAAIRWIVWGTLPLGGLIGGVLGSASVLGIRPTLWLSVTGSWAAGFWVLFSPLRRMRDIPADTGPPASGGPERG
ncbi:MAG TPA: MFS transporter [Streptosporangiaceae bacterium]|nr:MFS transporter [Streptosporangiaceae bacterium]